MRALFFWKSLGAFAIAATLTTILPNTAFASSLSAPSNIDVVGGKYTNDTTPTITWTRPSGATWYEFLVDNGDWQSLGNVSSYTMWNLPNGWHTFYVRAHNNSNAVSVSSSVTFEIDTQGATIPQVWPSTAIEDTSVTFSVTPYGEAATMYCNLFIDGNDVGSMTKSGTTFKKSYTFSWNGSYAAYAKCTDGDNNVSTGTSRSITVYNSADDEDTFENNLTVPIVTPSSATEDVRTEFTVKPSSDYNVTDCWLYVDGLRVTEMDEESTNVFVGDYTFRNDGSYSVYAYCKDSHENATFGSKRTIRVNDLSTDSTDEIDHGMLIKTHCNSYADVLDTCHAVYYYGDDGKRHVFPNESVFFTWYNDFDDVQEVSNDFLSSLSIGKNVTYRPGSVLVRFESSSDVYAVEKAHTLRRYTTTHLIEADYGDDWSDVLVTIKDSLYSNYSIGNVIDSTGDFDRDDEYFSVDSIDDVL
ncbi:MAG: hypothetical protein WCT28_01900 [Patescibacteria group bacterium]|jgi:hypothetical protein